MCHQRGIVEHLFFPGSFIFVFCNFFLFFFSFSIVPPSIPFLVNFVIPFYSLSCFTRLFLFPCHSLFVLSCFSQSREAKPPLQFQRGCWLERSLEESVCSHCKQAKIKAPSLRQRRLKFGAFSRATPSQSQRPKYKVLRPCRNGAIRQTSASQREAPRPNSDSG